MTLDDIDGTTDDDDWDKNDNYLDDDDHDKDDNGDYLYDSDDDKDGNERECFLPADRICRPAKKCSVVKFGQRRELKLVTMIVIIIMIFFVMIFLFIMIVITCERRELKG